MGNDASTHVHTYRIRLLPEASMYSIYLPHKALARTQKIREVSEAPDHDHASNGNDLCQHY